MSLRSTEAYARGSDRPPITFERDDLRVELVARFNTASDNDALYEAAASAETEKGFEGKKQLANSVLEFWEQYKLVIERINLLAEAGSPYQNAEDLTILQDQEYEVAQIALKLRNLDSAITSNDAVTLQTKVLLAQMIISPIKTQVLSQPYSMLSPVTVDAPASGFIDIEVLEAGEPSDREEKPGGSSTPGNEVVVIPGEDVKNQIELLVPLGAEERKAFQFLFDKFDSQIVPEMSGLVNGLNESETEYTTSYVDTFNDLADRIYDLEREVANPTLLASPSEYETMGQELRDSVNKAQVQYFALLQEIESQSASTADSLSEAGAEIIACNEALAQAENQLSAIKFALREAQAGPFKLSLDRNQKAMMDKVLVLLGDESHPNSIALTLQHLLFAKKRGENIDGNRVQLDNKLATLNKSLGELGRVLSQFMTEDDRQLFTDNIAPVATASLGAPAAEAAMVALPSVPAEAVEAVKSAPASIETTGQPERISEELFALYKAGSHDAIWPPADRSATMPEKRIGQITNEINAAMAKQGYTREAVTAFYKDKLHGIFSTILVAYRQEKNDEIRAQKLYDSFDELLQNVAAKLNTAPEVSPAGVDTPLVQAEALPVVGPDLPKDPEPEPDLAMTAEKAAVIDASDTSETSEASTGLVESVTAIPEAVHERKETMINVLEADVLRLRNVRNRVISEMSSVSEDNKPLVTFSLRLINQKFLAAITEYKSFKTISADDLEIGKKFLTVSRSIQEQLTIVKEIVAKLHSEISGRNDGTPGDRLDVNLDEAWAPEGDLDIDLDKLNEEVELASNVVSPEQALTIDLDLNDQQINVDERPANFTETTGIFASDSEMYPPDINTQLLPGIQTYYREFEALINKGLESNIEEKIRAIFFGDNSIESLLWQAKSDFEDEKSTSKLYNEIQKKMVDLDALIQPNLYRFDLGSAGVHLDVVAGEDDLAGVTDKENIFSGIDNPQEEADRLKSLQRELADMKEQVGRLREYVASQGAEASPEVLRVLEMIESTENAPELDQKVSSMNLDRRLRAIKKILNGEDKRSGPYFTALSPEARLVMAGLPRTPEESGARALEDGDTYEQALTDYREARLNFMGGTRKIGLGTDVTLDGSVRTEKVMGQKAEYEHKLQEFYANPGRLNKLKNVFGFKPKLTPELEALRAQYGEAKAEYARALQAVLAVRGARFDTNKAFDTKSTETNQAFGRKFVLKEFRQQQKIQAEALDTPKNETIQKILGVMRKHKWAMRGISVLGAGVVAGGGLAALGIGAAALSGTAAAIGSATAAARIAGVIGLGGLLGKRAHTHFQKGVNSARVDLEAAEKSILSDFDVDKMDSSQELLKQGTQRLSAAERTQKVATFAAAVAPGGLLAATSAMEILTGAASEPALAQSFEIDPAVPGRPTMVVEKVDFTGKGVNKDAVPSEEWIKMRGSAVQKVSDLLAARPNLPEVEVERLVLEKIKAEFNAKPWWDDANIDGIDVGIAERAPVSAKGIDTGVDVTPTPMPMPMPTSAPDQAPSPEAGVAAIPLPPPPPVPSEAVVAAPRYEVKTGDTLSKVTLDKFGSSEIMKGLTPAEQKAAIYELMERAQNKVALRDSIGLRGDNINKIYAEQEINLSGLETELKAIVAKGDYKTPDVPNQPTRGDLKVSTLDGGVNTLPITVAASPSDFGAETSLPSPILSERPVLAEVAPRGEIVQTVYKVPEVPRPYSLSGNYLDTREYRGFVTEVFGSIEKFNRAVQAEVTQFERGTYDALDRLMGINVYLSPYKEFANLTMAEIDLKRAELEGMKNQYDTFGGQNIKNPFGEVGQMKYETYRASVERLDQLKREYAWTPTTKLSDFIGRVVAETRAAELAEAKTLLQA